MTRSTGALWVIGAALVASCTPESALTQLIEVQPEPWNQAVEQNFPGPDSIAVSAHDSRIHVLGWVPRRNSCYTVFPHARRGLGTLQVDVVYYPKGSNCRTTDAWLHFDAGFAVPKGEYRVRVEFGSPPKTIERHVSVGR